MDPRIKWIIENVHGNRILDIGCSGKGYAHKILCKRNFDSFVVGIDINKKLLKSLPIYNHLVLADSMTLPVKTRSFDAIFMGELIEHVLYPRILLREVYRVLETKGRLYITTPNILALHRILRYMIKGTNQMGDPHHQILFDPFSLSKLLQTEGFHVISIETKRIYFPVPFFKRSLGPFDFKVFPFTRLGANICIVAIKQDKMKK